MCKATYHSGYFHKTFACEIADDAHDVVTDEYGVHEVHRATRVSGHVKVGRRYFTDVYEPTTEPFVWDDEEPGAVLNRQGEAAHAA